MTAPWEAYLSEHETDYLEQFLEFLRIPSVSTDPAQAGEVRRAGEWLAARLRQAGMDRVEILETGGHPVVYAERLRVPGKPTVLVYGHFDVQPADPLELWTSPPFEPAVRDGRVYARGASDMKGSDLLPIFACEALLSTGAELPVNVKFMYEGEEEIGSPSLPRFIAEHKDLLACDLVLCADGGVGPKDAPAVNVGRRGLCGLEIQVTSAGTDLHSGGAGGMAPNAIHALVHILDAMRDEVGRILVPGFYDEVRPLTEQDKAEIAAVPFHPDAYKRSIGIKDFFGEPEFTPQERNVARPTLEVNGIWGGYQGAGVKTVIPREAHAKITCRLVPDQRPEVIRERLIQFIHQVAPGSVEVRVTPLPGEADPYLLPLDHPGLLALEKAVTAVSERPPVRVRGGGTVPVTGIFQRELGAETVTLGASAGQEGAHAPNEFVRLENFYRIQRAFCILFETLGETPLCGRA
ncbi:MAG: dipeptidase [Alicyclobacillus sp.]|nr:dipeptidase [Alicyclobacillus sp.]